MSDETSGTEGTKEIAADIEQTRHDLAETIDALAAKADVPTRVREKAAQARVRTGSFTAGVPYLLYATGGVCAATGLWLLRRKRR